MDYIENMSTLPRHGHLVSSFFADIKALFVQKKVYPLQEQHSLVYWGKRYSGDEHLVDVSILDDKDYFALSTIEQLAFIQPDFMLFQNNEYLHNRTTSRIAGVPDIVVEVWSDTNIPAEREMKFRIYSSHPMCEHWYIEQYSNEVECWLGTNPLARQDIRNVLKTTHDLEFDLRYLAI